MNKEICELCEEYSINTECENESTCKINSVVEENKKLKEENKRLKRKISRLENEMSYMSSPNQIGDRCEMGG